nr:hypothetical protein [uncultured Friedmanniella sp.]
MRRAIVILTALALALVMYVIGVVMMLTTDGANEIPTPGYALVGGVLAMFATLGVFIAGFILTATDEA